MSVITYKNPAALLNSFNTFFDDHETKGSYPKTNLSKSENGFELQIALPGYKKENVEIKIENNQLLIEAKPQDLEKKFLRQDIAANDVKLSYKLAPTIQQDGICAGFEDGVLSVVLPIEEVKKEVKVINIL